MILYDYYVGYDTGNSRKREIISIESIKIEKSATRAGFFALPGPPGNAWKKERRWHVGRFTNREIGRARWSSAGFIGEGVEKIDIGGEYGDQSGIAAARDKIMAGPANTDRLPRDRSGGIGFTGGAGAIRSGIGRLLDRSQHENPRPVFA